MGAVKKTLTVFFGHGLVVMVGLIQAPLILKRFGPEIYGQYLVLISIISLIVCISNFGIGIQAKRYLPSTENPSGRASLFYPQLIFQISSATALGLLFTALCIYFPSYSPPLISIWVMAPWLFFHSLYNQAVDYFRYTGKVHHFNIATTLHPSMSLAIVFVSIMIMHSMTLKSLVYSAILATASIGCISMIWIYRELNFDCQLPKMADLRHDMVLGLPLLFSFAVEILVLNCDRFIIASQMTAKDVGFYGAAYSLGSLPLLIPRVLNISIGPLICQRLDADDIDGVHRLTYTASLFYLLLSIPYIVVLTFYSKDVLVLYANSEVAQASWVATPLLAAAAVFYGGISISSGVLLAEMRSSLALKVNLICLVVNIIINLSLVWWLKSIVVPATALGIGYAVGFLYLLRQLGAGTNRTFGKTSSYASVLLGGAFMSAIIFFLKNTFQQTAMASKIASIFLGLAVYCGIVLRHHDIRSTIARSARLVLK